MQIIGFKNNKNLKSHLVRTAFSDINKIGRCEPCGGKRPYQLCSNMKNTSNCNSKKVLYLIECRVCRKQCNGSAVTKFRARANNYKSKHRNFRKEQIPST